MPEDISHTLSESDTKKWLKRTHREYNKDLSKWIEILKEFMSNDSYGYEYNNIYDIDDHLGSGGSIMPNNPIILMKRCKKFHRMLFPLKCKWNITMKKRMNKKNYKDDKLVHDYISFGNYLVCLQSDIRYLFLYHQYDKYRQICQQFRNSNLHDLKNQVQNLERNHNTLLDKFRLYINQLVGIVEPENAIQYCHFFQGKEISLKIFNFLKSFRRRNSIIYRYYLEEYFEIFEEYEKWLNEVNIYWNEK